MKKNFRCDLICAKIGDFAIEQFGVHPVDELRLTEHPVAFQQFRSELTERYGKGGFR